jgi:hypothetical protein
MHQAVELLLKRMDRHPEEFIKPHPRFTRWSRILREYTDYMNEEENNAIKDKCREIYMSAMQKDVMAELLYGQPEEGDTAYEIEYEN